MEDRFRQYFEEIPCYLVVLDPALRIVEANRRFRVDFGESTGSRCCDVCRKREEKCPDCPAEKTLRDGGCHRSEEVFITQDGEEVHVTVQTQAVREADGRVVAVLQLAAESGDSHGLRSRLSSLGQLVGSISHELKGHLTGLDGGVYMMNSGYAKGDSARVKKGLDMVVRNVERIRNAVLNILYYAKDREPQWAAVSVPEYVHELAEAMQKKAQGLNIGFQLSLADGIGRMDVDPKAMQSMLANLLESSFETCSTDPDKREHRVFLAVSEEAGAIVFRIEDNGKGIDPELREKALGPYFPTKMLGTGLGIFISNKIAAAHGGTLAVESGPGTGTTFTVRIPRERG